MKKIVFGLGLLLMSNTALSYDGWSEGTIRKIRIQESGRVLITQTGATNPGDCTNTDYLNLIINDSVAHKEMYSALLAAYAAGKTVSLALTGCSPYPVITEVWLK